MGYQIAAAQKRSAEAWRLARRQPGILTRGDLLALGFTPQSIKHRVAAGRLHPVVAGVYAVGRPQVTREGRWMAAVLACGLDAVLSHGSASALWGIGNDWKLIEVTVRRRTWPRRRGIKVRTRRSLPSEDVATHLGVPVTTPARTILDRPRRRWAMAHSSASSTRPTLST